MKHNSSFKVAIIGAGFVGSTAAYALLIKGLCSEITLIDLHKEKAQGEAMDLEHGLQFVKQTKINFSNNTKDCKGADLIIICAGAHQKPGETRLDLIQKNAAIFKGMIPKITRHNKSCIFLIVSNPVDILTYLTIKYSRFPAHRVIGSGTTLDTARFKCYLSQKLKVSSTNVHTFILGEHGDSEFPVWSSATIAGTNLKDFGLTKKQKKSIFNKTTKAAYEIIAKKGATYYAIALSIAEIVEAIREDQNQVLPVSSLLKNYYGINNVCLSVPCVLGSTGIKKHLKIDLDRKELKNLKRSASILKGYIKKLK